MQQPQEQMEERRRQVEALLGKWQEAPGAVPFPELVVLCRGLQRLILEQSPPDKDDSDDHANNTCTGGDREGEYLAVSGYLRSLLQLVRDAGSSVAIGTLVLNLLAVVVKQRPTLALPVVVPHVLELWERHHSSSSSLSSSSSSNQTDWRSLQHGLRLLLGTVTSLPQAEPYCPLIDDALKAATTTEPKRMRKSSQSATSLASSSSSLPYSLSMEQEAQEDARDEDLERAQLRSQLDVTHLPPDIVADLLVAVLPAVNDDRLPLLLGKWRPQASSSATAQLSQSKAPTPGMADPRRKRAAPPSQSKSEEDAVAIAFTHQELQALVTEGVMRTLREHAGTCPEHVARLLCRLMALHLEDLDGSSLTDVFIADNEAVIFGGVLACLKQFITAPHGSNASSTVDAGATSSSTFNDGTTTSTGSGGITTADHAVSGDSDVKRNLLACWLRALWFTFGQSAPTVFDACQRWLLLRVILSARPQWLPGLADQSPHLNDALIIDALSLMDGVHFQARDQKNTAQPSEGKKLDGLSVDFVTTLALGRANTAWLLSLALAKLTAYLEAPSSSASNIPPSTCNSALAATKAHALDALCRLYAAEVAAREVELLAERHRDLWYGLLRVNPLLLFAPQFRHDNDLVAWEREREAIARAVNKCPRLATVVKDHLYAHGPSAWLPVLMAVVHVKLLAPIVPWLAGEIIEHRLDACFVAVFLAASQDIVFSAIPDQDARHALTDQLWPLLFTALMTSPPDLLHALNVHSQASDAKVSEEERMRLMARYAGKLVEWQWLGVADLLVYVHQRSTALGGLEASSLIIQTLLLQPAWRQSSILTAALQRLTAESPPALLLYQTLLRALSLLSKSAVLNSLVRVFKHRPWDLKKHDDRVDEEHAIKAIKDDPKADIMIKKDKERDANVPKEHWEGILRILRATLPESCVAALQLPTGQLRAALVAIPELRAPLRDYLSQQPPSYRNRFRDIFSSLSSSSSKPSSSSTLSSSKSRK